MLARRTTRLDVWQICRRHYLQRCLSHDSTASKLEKIIHDTIKATGPITVAQYMQLCLSHPTEGYYMNPKNAIFGGRGDFITSPEISQIFGELIGVWHLSRWAAAGSPSRIRIVELGPGRGTLLDDTLRTMHQFEAAKKAISSVHLVETSPHLRQQQEQKLEQYRKEHFPLLWTESLEDILQDKNDSEDIYTMVVAHELFDALPVHVIERGEGGWHEVLITSEPDSAAKIKIKESDLLVSSSISQPTPKFRFVKSLEPTPAANILGSSSRRFSERPIGSRVEISPVSFKIARQTAELINQKESAGGSALIIDYGDKHSFGSSLRAFKNHKIVDLFETPGQCDITANVDFAYISEAVEGMVNVHGPLTQRSFLQNMGLAVRLGKLLHHADKDKELEISRAAMRLVAPGGMGTQYKALGLTSAGGREPSAEEKEVWPYVASVLQEVEDSKSTQNSAVS